MKRIKERIGKNWKWLCLPALEGLLLLALAVLKMQGLLYVEKLLGRSLLALLAINLLIGLWALDRARQGRPGWAERRRAAGLVLCIAILASLPLFADYLNFVPGHDHEFHLIRIEGVVEGIRDGQFPVRIHPETLSGYGYGAPIFYPELLLYFPALLRLMGLTVQGSFQVFCFFVNLATAAVAYHSFRSIFSCRRLGLIGSFLYTLSLYRLACMYTRCAVGEFTAMIFLPLAAWGLYRILALPAGGRENRLAFVPLMLGMTGLLYTHSLTAAAAAAVLAVFCLCCLRRVFEKQRFFQLLLAVLGTLLLTAAYLGPMLHAGTRMETAIFTKELQRRFVHAINPYQLFPLLPPAVGISEWHDSGVPGEMPLGVGLAGLLILMLHCFAAKKRGGPENRLGRLSFILSAVLLVMTTEIFPWEGIYRLGGIFARVAGTLQFPWRLLSVATVLLCLTGLSALWELNGKNSPSLNRSICLILCLVTLITASAYTDNLMQGAEVFRPKTAHDLDRRWGVMNGEFLPAAAGRYSSKSYDGALIPEAGLEAELLSRSGTRLEVQVSNPTERPLSLSLPRLFYPGYRAVLEDGRPLPVSCGPEGLIALTLPAGTAGRLSVTYRTPGLWRCFEAASLLSALALGLMMLRRGGWLRRQERAYPLWRGEEEGLAAPAPKRAEKPDEKG